LREKGKKGMEKGGGVSYRGGGRKKRREKKKLIRRGGDEEMRCQYHARSPDLLEDSI